MKEEIVGIVTDQDCGHLIVVDLDGNLFDMLTEPLRKFENKKVKVTIEEIDPNVSIKNVDCFKPQNGRWTLSTFHTSDEKGDGGEQRIYEILPIPPSVPLGDARTVAKVVWGVIKRNQWEAPNGKMYPYNPVLHYEFNEVLED